MTYTFTYRRPANTPEGFKVSKQDIFGASLVQCCGLFQLGENPKTIVLKVELQEKKK